MSIILILVYEFNVDIDLYKFFSSFARLRKLKVNTLSIFLDIIVCSVGIKPSAI